MDSIETNRISAAEAISKSELTYSPVELRFLRTKFPTLQTASQETYSQLFSINGQPLSITTLSLLHDRVGLVTPEDIHAFLSDESNTPFS
ncbi:MAG TPA: hypothetical protein VMR41_02790 [Patescibacteria group bacterium]|nr:hypothetical protein [Patescibacteria group bacterium]